MRKQLLSSVLVACMLLALLVLVIPARADGPGSPFWASDKRAAPNTADRVAVYCNTNGVDVWGIDTNKIGFRLTSFTPAEMNSQTVVVHNMGIEGTVTLEPLAQAKIIMSYMNYDDKTLDPVVKQEAQYKVSWTGGHDGATGISAFNKVFKCTYMQT